jgi:hypothetical protein
MGSGERESERKKDLFLVLEPNIICRNHTVISKNLKIAVTYHSEKLYNI